MATDNRFACLVSPGGSRGRSPRAAKQNVPGLQDEASRSRTEVDRAAAEFAVAKTRQEKTSPDLVALEASHRPFARERRDLARQLQDIALQRVKARNEGREMAKTLAVKSNCGRPARRRIASLMTRYTELQTPSSPKPPPKNVSRQLSPIEPPRPRQPPRQKPSNNEPNEKRRASWRFGRPTRPEGPFFRGENGNRRSVTWRPGPSFRPKVVPLHPLLLLLLLQYRFQQRLLVCQRQLPPLLRW